MTYKNASYNPTSCVIRELSMGSDYLSKSNAQRDDWHHYDYDWQDKNTLVCWKKNDNLDNFCNKAVAQYILKKSFF